MPKSHHTTVNQTPTYSNLRELKKNIENLNTYKTTMRSGRAFGSPDPYFELSKEKLKLLSKDEYFLSIFSPEIDRTLTNLEAIRQIYAKYDEKIATRLAQELKRDVEDTLSGIERVQNKYLNNRDIEDVIGLSDAIEKDIHNLQQTEKDLLEQIQSIDVKHEDIIQVLIKNKYGKEDLDTFCEVIDEHYGMDLGKEHGKYLKKQLLQDKYKNIQQEISELKKVLPSLQSSAQENSQEEQDQHHSGMSFKGH